MKKIFYLFIFIFLIFNFSCLSDNTEDITIDNTIWTMKRVNLSNSNIDNEIITFYKDNGKYYIKNSEILKNFIGDLDGNTIIFTNGNENGTITFQTDKSASGSSKLDKTEYSYSFTRIN